MGDLARHMFRAEIDLGHFITDHQREVSDAIQNSIYDALDDLGVQYQVAEISVVEIEDPDENSMGPFARGSETSRKAAIDNYPRSGSQRHRVLLSIAAEGGCTAEEVAEDLDLRLNSVRPRVVELREGGWIEDTPKTRKTPTGSEATVMVLTEKGQRYVKDKEYVLQ